MVRASVEGKLGEGLMEDMALYFRVITDKDWSQLAKLLGHTSERPGTRFDLVFSDPQDLRILLRRLDTWGGPLGRIRVFDATAHAHFHHMSRKGLLENLCAALPEAWAGN